VNPQDELNALTDLFPVEKLIEQADHVSRHQTPEPYKTLLVHEQHMTVTMEQYHNTSVDVRVLDEVLDGDLYHRKIVLVKSATDDVVQFGIVRFNFEFVTVEVRDHILEGKIPLGRILIDYNVLRHIDLGAILRIKAGPGLAKHMQMQDGQITYGRMATIFCNHRPALDLLEVSAPLEIES
jgi:chorismate-pyruvate lyase